MNMQTSDSIVIIPTYNERENIENIIRAAVSYTHLDVYKRQKEYRLTDWLPTTRKEVELRGWDELDVILFSS